MNYMTERPKAFPVNIFNIKFSCINPDKRLFIQRFDSLPDVDEQFLPGLKPQNFKLFISIYFLAPVVPNSKPKEIPIVNNGVRYLRTYTFQTIKHYERLEVMAARVQTSYVAIRGEVNRNEFSFVYGLNAEIERYLTLYYDACARPGEPIHHFHGSAMNIIDTLSDSGYQIVTRTCDGPMSTWILKRLETICGCSCHKFEADDMEPIAGPSSME